MEFVPIKKKRELFEKNLSLVNALNPILGYDSAAEPAKMAFQSGKTIRKLTLKKNILIEHALKEILDCERMTLPGCPFPAEE